MKKELRYFICFGWLVVGLLIGYGFRGTKEIFVSDRLFLCEAKGGKYTFGYNEFSGRYYETCKIVEVELDLDL